MNTRLPPRYLPTLTEVVYPSGLQVVAVPPEAGPASVASVAAFAPPTAAEPDLAPAPTAPAFGAAPLSATPDRHALAQQIIQLVRPQLETELRKLAQEHFDAQFNVLLPSLQLRMEAAVREAIAQSLPEQPDSKNDVM